MVSSTCITAHKEELQQEIEKQQEMWTEDLLDVDQYLAKINLKDLESSSGEPQEYWLVAICATQEASIPWRQQQVNTCRRELMGRGHLHWHIRPCKIKITVDGLLIAHVPQMTV